MTERGLTGEARAANRPDEVLRSFMWAYKVATGRLEAAFAAAGAPSLIESVVLTALHRAEGGRLPLHSLGRGLPQITKSGVSRLIDRMERSGLVERQDSEADKRVTYAAITDRGRTGLRYAAAVFRNAYARTFGDALSPDEVAFLVHLLDKLRAANQTAAPGGFADEDDAFLPPRVEELWRAPSGREDLEDLFYAAG
jgi:DNA-binding MarR family transcriptional regulator